MKFQKYPPSEATQSMVAYYWTLRSTASEEGGTVYRFVPDAYVDWVFHLKNPWSFNIPAINSERLTCQAHLFTQVKTYMDLLLPEQELYLFGVKFHPWAARQIWKVDLSECTDRCIGLMEIDLRGSSFLVEQVYEAKTVSERIQCIEAFILETAAPQKLFSLAPLIRQMERDPLTLPKPMMGIKRRRLEQRFKAEIGISPKLFQRTIRINKMINRLIQQPNIRLTDLAYEFHFFDQSHFISDFRKFTGCTPKQFLRCITPDGDIYNFKPASVQY